MDVSKRHHGETWIAEDGRVCVAVKVVGALATELVSMIVATGAEKTYLPDDVLARVGVGPEIRLLTENGLELRMKPELGPILPQHRNSVAQGVLGMDVRGRIDSTISFKSGLAVRGFARR